MGFRNVMCALHRFCTMPTIMIYVEREKGGGRDRQTDTGRVTETESDRERHIKYMFIHSNMIEKNVTNGME